MAYRRTCLLLSIVAVVLVGQAIAQSAEKSTTPSDVGLLSVLEIEEELQVRSIASSMAESSTANLVKHLESARLTDGTALLDTPAVGRTQVSDSPAHLIPPTTDVRRAIPR